MGFWAFLHFLKPLLLLKQGFIIICEAVWKRKRNGPHLVRSNVWRHWEHFKVLVFIGHFMPMPGAGVALQIWIHSPVPGLVTSRALVYRGKSHTLIVSRTAGFKELWSVILTPTALWNIKCFFKHQWRHPACSALNAGTMPASGWGVCTAGTEFGKWECVLPGEGGMSTKWRSGPNDERCWGAVVIALHNPRPSRIQAQREKLWCHRKDTAVFVFVYMLHETALKLFN